MNRHSWGEVIRTLWFLPAVFVVVSMAGGYLLSRVEIADDHLLSGLVFRGTASSARQLLAVVSSTMITVTGLVFVLTVIALQIASTQFSPRLLRSFLTDPGTRLVLSFFVATFAYSLAGLFTVGQETATGDEFVPQLAVTGSLVLALVSVGMLVYYIQHITNSIRIDAVMQGVREATIAAIRRNYPAEVSDAEHHQPPVMPVGAVEVPIRRSGYVQAVDTTRLRKTALQHATIVRLSSEVGHHLVAGRRIAWAWPLEPSHVIETKIVAKEVNAAVRMASERTVENDVGFGLRQLVDVAIKAVAPSVNDPYTAVQAIQHLSIAMTSLAKVDTTDVQIRSDMGDVVAYVPRPDFELLLETACGHVRRSATTRPRVLIALLRMLETVASVTSIPARRKAIVEQVRLIVEDAERDIPQPADIEPVRAMAVAALDATQDS